YDMGVRDPVRLATDIATGDTWFLDVSPGDKDELNRVVPLGNFGWSATRQTGYLDSGTLEDPYFVWAPAEGPSDFAACHGTNLGRGFDASLITVALGTGRIASVKPNLADRHAPGMTVLFTPDATGPQSFTAMAILPDGCVHTPE